MAKSTTPKSNTITNVATKVLTAIYHVANTGKPDKSQPKELQTDRKGNPIINPITKQGVMRHPPLMEEVTVDGETFERRVYSTNLAIQFDATGLGDGTYSVPNELSSDVILAIVNARQSNEAITKTIPDVEYLLNDNHEVYTREAIDEATGDVTRTLVFANYTPKRKVVRTSLDLADLL
mgnify:CR=1 FL=1